VSPLEACRKAARHTFYWDVGGRNTREEEGVRSGECAMSKADVTVLVVLQMGPVSQGWSVRSGSCTLIWQLCLVRTLRVGRPEWDPIDCWLMWPYPRPERGKRRWRHPRSVLRNSRDSLLRPGAQGEEVTA
jgi:hypothetical protein